MDNQSIIKFMNDHKAEMLEDLKAFIEIPSVSEDLTNVAKALKYILALGKKYGFKTESCLNGQVGVIEMGDCDETLGILTHVDVVNPGNIKDWHTEPFEMKEIDGKLFGRGTLDDKGAIIASLYAMRAVLESGEKTHKKVQLIMGTQEEVDWTDMEAYVKSCKLPDYGFTPDGEFPICNIEKGCSDIKMNIPVKATYITGKYLVRLDAGVANNIVPGECTAEIATYEEGKKISSDTITVSGKSVHSCQPEKGINAFFKMAEKLRKLDLTESPLLELALAVDDSFKDIYGKAIGLYNESEYYNGEFVHRNVFSPTIFKTNQDEAVVNVNIRSAYGGDEEKTKRFFDKFAAKRGGEVAKMEYLPPVYVSRQSPFLKSLAAAYEEITGKENTFELAYGGSYAKAMPNVVSWGPIFPGEEDTCHEDNEYIAVDSLMANAEIFASAIGRIVFAEESFK